MASLRAQKAHALNKAFGRASRRYRIQVTYLRDGRCLIEFVIHPVGYKHFREIVAIGIGNTRSLAVERAYANWEHNKELEAKYGEPTRPL